jgi:hypothetical protein
MFQLMQFQRLELHQLNSQDSLSELSHESGFFVSANHLAIWSIS